MTESILRLKPASWVEISIPRAAPVMVTLPTLTRPPLFKPSVRPRPVTGEINVLVAIVKFTLPAVMFSAEPNVPVAMKTVPRKTVFVDPETTAAVEPWMREFVIVADEVAFKKTAGKLVSLTMVLKLMVLNAEFTPLKVTA